MKSLQLRSCQLFLFSCLYFYYPSKAEDIVRYFNCDSANNYTSGSVYQRNLNLARSSLSLNASLTGFYTITVGQKLNETVYGLIQCRGDISRGDCQTCASTVSEEIIQLCPNKKEASIGYDKCWLRYSNSRFFSSVDSFPRLKRYNPINASDPLVFNRQLGNLVKNLSSIAASNPSKFATGRINYTDFININAMVQCTKDLADNSCYGCLQDIIGYIPNCCDKKQGGRVFSLSCNLRFDIYLFSQLAPPRSLSAEFSPPSGPAQLEKDSASSEVKTSTSREINFILVIPASVAVALAVTLIACGCFFWRKARKKRYDIAHIPHHEEGDKSSESFLIGLDALKAATGNFSDDYKLGQGGFGSVYKGKLTDGREIAVKRLSSSSGQGLEELKTEVTLVAKLLHRNLVRLLGFCLEEKEKLLVYEYLPNGSMDKLLFDKSKSFSLNWERRYKIIVGIARGLLYLHEDSQLRIIHRDLKASNVLLDEYMNPKISDFGLAKMFGETQIQGRTNRIAGTYGYMAPEYARNGQFSMKSDVYSYGVLILEIVTGLKNSSSTTNLPSCAWQHWCNGTAMDLLDPALGDHCPENEVLKCIHIGLLCVQVAAADRPAISEVVMMLSSHTLTSPVPSRPAYFVSRESSKSDLGMEDSRMSRSNAESSQFSVNNVTITELDSR